MNYFQNPKEITDLYSDINLIGFRGNFLKTYSIRDKSLRDVVIESLNKPVGKNIIDIGCGDCSFLKNLLENYPNNNVYALDTVENKNCYVDKISYSTYKEELYPTYTKKFDYILLMHMLYHVNNFDSFFLFIKGLMKNDTEIIITTKSINTFAKIETIYKDIIKSSKISIEIKEKVINTTRDEVHFCIENAEEVLDKYFNKERFKKTLIQLKTPIKIQDKVELLKYIFSTRRYHPKYQFFNPKEKELYIKKWKKELEKHTFFEDYYIEGLIKVENRT